MVRETDDYHWEIGLHSNIPGCCIAFWLGWKKLDHNDDYMQLIVDSQWYEYLPCPVCFMGGVRNQLMICAPSCDHRKEWAGLHNVADLWDEFFEDMRSGLFLACPQSPGYVDPTQLTLIETRLVDKPELVEPRWKFYQRVREAEKTSSVIDTCDW